MSKVLLLAALLFAAPVVALAPTAEACLYVYTEVGVGPVSVVQRSTCSEPEVYLDGEPVLP